MSSLNLHHEGVTAEYPEETFSQIVVKDPLNWLHGTRHRMRYNGSTFPSYVKHGFVDVFVEHDDEFGRTEKYIATRNPIAFDRAVKIQRDLLTLAGRPPKKYEDGDIGDGDENLDGFVGTVNVTLIPRSELCFLSSEARDAWLLEEVRAMAFRRKEEDLNRMAVIGYAYRRFVAGEITAEVQHKMTMDYAKDPDCEASQQVLAVALDPEQALLRDLIRLQSDFIQQQAALNVARPWAEAITAAENDPDIRTSDAAMLRSEFMGA